MDAKIKTYLDRLADSPKRPSSFLFSGADGQEKIEASFYFIQKLSGKIGKGEFADQIRNGVHPDVVILEPEIVEDKKGRIREKEIVIEQIRKARERLKYFPYQLEKKFCVIKKAQRMNTESSNALLKILEEPTASTILILLANDAESVLPTISSLCAVLRFPAAKLPVPKKENITRLREILRQDIHEKFEFAEKISKNRNEAVETLKDWEGVLSEGLRNLASRENFGKLDQMADLVRQNRDAVNRIENSNANTRAVLENLMLDLKW